MGFFGYFNLIYHRRIKRKNSFYPHAAGNPPHCEGGPRLPAVLPGEHNAFKGLQAVFTLFVQNPGGNVDGIASPKIKLPALRNVHRAEFYFIDYVSRHNKSTLTQKSFKGSYDKFFTTFLNSEGNGDSTFMVSPFRFLNSM